MWLADLSNALYHYDYICRRVITYNLLTNTSIYQKALSRASFFSDAYIFPLHL